jgi:hypothetical protein
MKSKLQILIFALLLTGMFSACAEEEITPNDNLNYETVGDGVTMDDTNF